VTDADVRLWIYRHFVDHGRAPSPNEIGRAFGLTPSAVGGVLQRLQDEADAIVLLPDSSYLWMAEPFSAVPTSYPVVSGESSWWGNCIWDALAILALVGRDGVIDTECPESGESLRVEVVAGHLVPSDAVVHYLVPASEWWRSIGFT